MKLKKIITITAVAVISVLLIYGFILISQIFSANTKFEEKEVYVHIPTGADYSDVKEILAPYIKNFDNFELVANKRSYPENVKSGRFLLKKDMNNIDLVRAMRSNVPVKLAFNNQEKVQDLFVRLASQIEPDTTKLKDIFRIRHNRLQILLIAFHIGDNVFCWSTHSREIWIKCGFCQIF